MKHTCGKIELKQHCFCHQNCIFDLLLTHKKSDLLKTTTILEQYDATKADPVFAIYGLTGNSII